MNFDLTYMLPNNSIYNPAVVGSLITLDFKIRELNKKINDHYEHVKFLSTVELDSVKNDLKNLLMQKESKEVKIIFNLERVSIAGHFAKLDPTWIQSIS